EGEVQVVRHARERPDLAEDLADRYAVADLHAQVLQVCQVDGLAVALDADALPLPDRRGARADHDPGDRGHDPGAGTSVVVVPVVLPAALVGAAAAAPHHVVALTGRERHPVDACRHELTSRYRGGRETWGTPARGLGPRPP